jgi:hypothetical protein
MKTRKNADHPVAIPTTFKGIEFKSRLEAQTAFLFETFGIPWQYEPKSLMLPNGICYTPDFWLGRQRTFFECRGYENETSEKQIECFGESVQAEGGYTITPPGILVQTFIVLYGTGDTRVYQRWQEYCENGILLSWCCLCKHWYLGGFDQGACLPCCTNQNASQIVLALTASKGKLFLNGKPSEAWKDGAFTNN